MNSYNHFVFGSMGYWFYEYLLGFKNADDSVGYSKINIKPYFDDRIKSANGSYDSKNGKITVSFDHLDDNTIKYSIETRKGVVVFFNFDNQILEKTIIEAGDFILYNFILLK